MPDNGPYQPNSFTFHIRLGGINTISSQRLLEGPCLKRTISSDRDRVRWRETVNEVCVKTMRNSSCTTTTLEQETARHVRSESVPHGMGGPVFGLWVRAAAETINAAHKALDILTSAGGDCAAVSVRIVRRLSTVPGRQGLLISRRA